jgi:hypothetical protein
MSCKYSRKELAEVDSGEFPDKGDYCKKCETWIPQFEELDDATETRIIKLIIEQRKIAAMKELEAKVGCNQRWSKIWVLHKGKPTPEYPGPPCPYCGGQLRTSLAKQCPQCFKSWHNK